MSHDKSNPDGARHEAIHYRSPEVVDGAKIWQLVKDTGVLDVNSAYSYLLLGEHFPGTSVVAELEAPDGEKHLAGFISAYCRPPPHADTVFVWQVGVAESGRGRGVATGMLYDIIGRPACANVTHLETTVGPSNEASMALFRGFAKKLGTEVVETELFSNTHFPDPDDHEPEVLFRIGPFDSATA